MTASRVIYQGDGYQPKDAVLLMMGLLVILGIFLLYDLSTRVREKRKKSRLLDAQIRQAEADARVAEARAAPQRGRHSGPQPAIPDQVPREWVDERWYGKGGGQ